MLPGPDRNVLLKALHAEPQQRFASNVELVNALVEAGLPHTAVVRPTPASARTLGVARPVSSAESASRVLAPLLVAATSETIVRERRGMRYLQLPGPVLRLGCVARLPSGTARLRLGLFREEWKATTTVAAGLATFRVPVGASLWQRCIGMGQGLDLSVKLQEPRGEGQTYVEVEVRPFGCGGLRAEHLLDDLAPRLLESLHHCLQAAPERRRALRLPLDLKVQAHSLETGGEPGAHMAATILNVSSRGMGLSLSSRPSGNHLVVQVPQPGTRPTPLPGRIVHVSATEEGKCLVGLDFMHNDVD
jgi:hypothetical protein